MHRTGAAFPVIYQLGALKQEDQLLTIHEVWNIDQVLSCRCVVVC